MSRPAVCPSPTPVTRLIALEGSDSVRLAPVPKIVGEDSDSSNRTPHSGQPICPEMGSYSAWQWGQLGNLVVLYLSIFRPFYIKKSSDTDRQITDKPTPGPHSIPYNPPVAEDKGKEEEKFDFTPEGEGYISLDEATLSARQLVRQDEQHYLNRTGWEEIVWSTSESEAGDVSIKVILQFRRPNSGISEDAKGLEEFLFGYDGELQDRQVISWPDDSSASAVKGPPLDVEKKPNGGKPRSSFYLEAGISYEEAGQYESAISEFDMAIQLDSDNAYAYHLRALSYSKLGRLSEAISDYTSAIQLDPDDLVYHNRGRSYERLGEHELAIQDHGMAIKLDSNHAAYYLWRGMSLRESGEYLRAIENYDKAIQLEPSNGLTYQMRALAFRQLGEYQKSISDSTKAIEFDPKASRLYQGRGQAYRSFGNYADAMRDYNKALQLNPDGADILLGRGWVYAALQQHQRAIDDCTKSIQLDSDNPDAYHLRALSYSKLGRLSEAVSDYTSAIQVNPDFGDAYYRRGDCYIQLGYYQHAIDDYSKDIQLAPNFAKAYTGRANAYRQLGQTADADADDIKAQSIEDSSRNR